jgi:glycosyltransferase involved in cell wall biosynthesis
MANSRNVQKRIWRAWRRRSQVVYPPVATDTFRHRAPEDYFLMVSEMVPYKRLDYAIRCIGRSGRRLKVVGEGPEYKALKKLAGPSVEFCGRVTDIEIRDLYSRCRALVVPGEEDFGINMVESLASGKPVVALSRGGAVEIVGNGRGVLYAEPNEASLEDALRSFERVESMMDPMYLTECAGLYSEAAFRKHFTEALESMSRRGSPRANAQASAAPIPAPSLHVVSG